MLKIYLIIFTLNYCELDKKAKSMADEFGDAMKSVGKSLEDTFSSIVGKK